MNLNDDHTCWWTRRHLSELARREGSLAGAGLLRSALAKAAEQRGYSLAIVSRAEEEYDEEVALGSWRGNIHDGCFVSFDSDDAQLLDVLLAAHLELHGSYLGGSIKPECLAQLKDKLQRGMTVRLRSRPRESRVIAKTYRNDSGWWERLAEPGIEIECLREE